MSDFVLIQRQADTRPIACLCCGILSQTCPRCGEGIALEPSRMVGEEGWYTAWSATFSLIDGYLIHDHCMTADEIDERMRAPFGGERLPRKLYGLRRRVYERDAFKCVYCGLGENLSLDRVVPGGPYSDANCVTACRDCNSRKGSRTPEEASMKMCR